MAIQRYKMYYTDKERTKVFRITDILELSLTGNEYYLQGYWYTFDKNNTWPQVQARDTINVCGDQLKAWREVDQEID